MANTMYRRAYQQGYHAGQGDKAAGITKPKDGAAIKGPLAAEYWRGYRDGYAGKPQNPPDN